MIVFMPVAVCLIGAMAYVTVEKMPKLAELGRLAFWVGLLVTLLRSAEMMAFHN